MFPALEYLILVYPNDQEVETVMKLKLLVRNITYLSLAMYTYPRQSGRNWVIVGLSACQENVPRLNHLFLNFDFYHNREWDETNDIISIDTLNFLSKLPLHALEIRGATLEEIIDFEGKLPMLKRLELLSQEVHFDCLPRFAAIPKLEYLGIVLD